MTRDNTDLDSWIAEWATYNADLIRGEWGRDGKLLLAKIAKYAGVESQKPTTHHFEAFWAAWPKGKRKVDKAGCQRIWERYHLDDLINDILKALEMAKQDEDWLKQQGAFIPMPSVWLNQRRWEGILECSTQSDIFAGGIGGRR